MSDVLPEFEVFDDLGEGLEPRLIACVSGFENAKSMMQEVASRAPGRYFVWDPLEGEVVARITVA